MTLFKLLLQEEGGKKKEEGVHRGKRGAGVDGERREKREDEK